MAHVIAGIFTDSKAAGKAVSGLKKTGFTDDVSLVAVDRDGEANTHQVKQDAADGAAGGAIVGGP